MDQQAMESTSSPTDNSADQVASSDDILTEILRRLPVRSLLRFKSVSKHWYVLISSPSFKLVRNPNPDPPSGLFLPIQIKRSPSMEYEFIPFDVENPVKTPFKTLNFDPNVKRIDIEHSSNGLMLCHSQNVDVSEEGSYLYSNNKYYVYNPTINQFIVLPRPENYDNKSRFDVTLAFDPSKSPHYRVLYVCGSGSDYRMGELRYQIVIYSSETRSCKASCQFLLDKKMDVNFRAGVYWNDAVHWVHERGFVLYYRFNEEKICFMKTPHKPRGSGARHAVCLFESQGCLLLVDIFCPFTSEFNIYELKLDYSGWSVRYHVDLEEVGGAFPEMVNPECCVTFEFTILCVVLMDRDEDSFLVLKIPGKAIRYNLVLRTFEKLHDFNAYQSSLGSLKSDVVCCQIMPYAFQFMESLCGV